MAPPACAHYHPGYYGAVVLDPDGHNIEASVTRRREHAEPRRSFGRCFGMAEQDHLDRVWDIIEKVGVGMLVTQFPGGLRARPVEARPDRKAGLIWFMTDIRAAKDDEIADKPDVCLTFIDPAEKAYLSISARAQVLRDTGKAREFWKHTDKVWWPDGPEDSNLRVLRVEPQRAELWDGPASAAVAAFEFAQARLTGRPPNLGQNRKVTVEM